MSAAKIALRHPLPTLGDLADPLKFHEDIDLRGIGQDILEPYLEKMIQIRCVEERIGEGVKSKEVRCPCHLVIGQEAPPTALARYLTPKDKVFGAHRSHAHYLALGGELYPLFCEILGREPGCSKGMGGSMHLIDQKNGFRGSVPIVGATIPIATGAALASSLAGDQSVAVSFFGDGAAEEGVFHESLNLASTHKLPVIFFCENNLFSSHLHINLRQPTDLVSRYAEAHAVPSATIDGNDITLMDEVCKEAVELCRAGKGPVAIEAITYRWRGHVGPSEDNDVGLQRKDDLGVWKQRDPIARLYRSMEAAGMVSGDLEERFAKYRDAVDRVWNEALNAPFPEESALMDRVYA